MPDRRRGEFPEEEALLGIEHLTPDEEARRETDENERIATEAKFKREFLIRLMENQTFREWLMEQLVALRTFENTFGLTPTGFPDPMATQFALGQKAAGWHLWTIFDDVAPELASQMRRDHGKPKA